MISPQRIVTLALSFLATISVATAQWIVPFAVGPSNSFYTSGSVSPVNVSGTFSFTPEVAAGVAQVQVVFNNNSGGFLNGFGFRLANGLSYVANSFTKSSPTDSTLSHFDSLHLPPSGYVISGIGFTDIGSGNEDGGGSPSNGLQNAAVGTFTFWLTTGLGAGTTNSFAPASFFTGILPPNGDNPNDGIGDEFDMLLRLRGFANGGSTKVGLAVSPVALPEPQTYAVLLGVGALGVTFVRHVRTARSKRSASASASHEFSDAIVH